MSEKTFFDKELNTLSFNFGGAKHLIKIRFILIKRRPKTKNVRGNRPQVFYKKDFIKIFVKFAGKHLCWSLF